MTYALSFAGMTQMSSSLAQESKQFLGKSKDLHRQVCCQTGCERKPQRCPFQMVPDSSTARPAKRTDAAADAGIDTKILAICCHCSCDPVLLLVETALLLDPAQSFRGLSPANLVHSPAD